MVLGITTRSSTQGRAGHSTTGRAPEPPWPANSGWGGITTGGSGTSRPASVSGIISGWARVTWPGKICTPWMRTVR